MMENCPATLTNLQVVAWTFVDEQCTPTGNTQHWVDGENMKTVSGLAIGHCPADDVYYLLYCDDDWHQYTDTWHQSIDDAKAQAEYEYAGITSQWISL